MTVATTGDQHTRMVDEDFKSWETKDRFDPLTVGEFLVGIYYHTVGGPVSVERRCTVASSKRSLHPAPLKVVLIFEI